MKPLKEEILHYLYMLMFLVSSFIFFVYFTLKAEKLKQIQSTILNDVFLKAQNEFTNIHLK